MTEADLEVIKIEQIQIVDFYNFNWQQVTHTYIHFYKGLHVCTLAKKKNVAYLAFI